jgi:hypothetical protein
LLIFFRYPIVGTIGNLNTSTRSSSDSKLLLGFLPTITDEELNSFKFPDKNHADVRAFIFHRSIAHLLSSLEGQKGRGMNIIIGVLILILIF